MPSSKVCFKCNVEKPLTDFYKHEKMASGVMGKCKECTKADVTANRLKNLDRIREYDRVRAKIPERARRAARIAAAWRQQDSRRMKCHNAVARALRSGKLQHKPCEWPGCEREDSYAHHESYNRPLDVVFYCQPHHKKRHAEMKRLGIDPLAPPEEDGNHPPVAR